MSIHWRLEYILGRVITDPLMRLRWSRDETPAGRRRLLGIGDGLPQFARHRHGLERGVHNLRRPRLLRRVVRLGLDQLGVREDHAELVVESVKEFTRIFS